MPPLNASVEHLIPDREGSGHNQEWHSLEGGEYSTDLFRGRLDGENRLTIRLIAYSLDGQVIEHWANFTYESDSDTSIDNPVEVEMQVCQGCCGATYEIPVSDECGVLDCEPCDVVEQKEDESSSSDDTSIVLWTGIILAVLALLCIGAFLYLRRNTATVVEVPTTPSTTHAPCTDCGGVIQETVHNDDRWTWCPTCPRFPS